MSAVNVGDIVDMLTASRLPIGSQIRRVDTWNGVKDYSILTKTRDGWTSGKRGARCGGIGTAEWLVIRIK